MTPGNPYEHIPYIPRMIGRMIGLALAAVMGAMATGVILVPVSLLRELQVITFRVEESSLFWPIVVVGGLWGMAHMLDTIAEKTK